MNTVTFLFTDIEGSTQLWQDHPERMRPALARHDDLLRLTIHGHQGRVFKTVGDAFYAAFETPSNALAAAVAAQLRLTGEPWETPFPLRVRMALHTGMAEERDGDFFGDPLNRVSRILSAGHGGQILLSSTTRELLHETLLAQVGMRDMGQARLKGLSRPEQIYQIIHPDLPAQFPPLRSLDRLPNNLPLAMTSFIGRETEIAEVKTLLAGTRLLTMTGIGGAGKSRLSQQVAGDVLERYPDGVWLLELAALSDPSLVPQEVARVLQVREEAGQSVTDSLAAALTPKKLLLLLDNCEHVLAACADLTHTLLRRCPELQVFASSRQALGVAGEQVYRLQSLSAPTVDVPTTPDSLVRYESVRLFLDRAALIKPDFALTRANATAVAQICHRLDGIPFAIELAAARAGALTVEQINARLDNRFRLLTGGSRTALPRQQTLRALLDWSYNLLDDAERLLLCGLSVFAGGWSLEAAEAVGTDDPEDGIDVLDQLSSLAEKSLVVVEYGADGGSRYRLLETVRQYGLERLAESGRRETVLARHQAYFLELAERAAAHLDGPEQAVWLDALQADLDNLRAAQDHCRQSPRETTDCLRFAAALRRFWMLRGLYHEGFERAKAILEETSEQTPTPTRAAVFRVAAILARLLGDYYAAASFQEQGLAISRELGDVDGVATALSSLGNLAFAQGQYRQAQSLFEECLALWREQADTSGIAYGLVSLGVAHYALNDYASARRMNEEALSQLRRLGDTSGIARCLSSLGGIALKQDDYPAATGWLSESLTLFRHLGDQNGMAMVLDSLAALALCQNQTRRAIRLFGASATLYEKLSITPTTSDREQTEEQLSRLKLMVPQETYDRDWAAGRAMTMEEAVAAATKPPV